ncbi:MAG TPA: peptidyl-prolyl cis-trans isomerase [Myxococcales bacterium]|nr:peptidyl-prolyl cis-trans isomerase [Myxococcales bacterium]
MRFLLHRGGRVAIAAAGLLCFSCRRAPPPAPPAPPAAATVNGMPIPLASVQRELDRVRRGEDNITAQADPKDTPHLARALLEGLIDRAIVLQRAKAEGLQVSEAEIQRATDAMADDMRKGGAAFNDQLAIAGQTQEQLAEETRDRLLGEKYVAGETARERASAAETRAWYDEHRDEFSDPEQVHCLQIAVRTPDEAKSVLDQLRAGAAFDKLARQVSISPDGRDGGDLGWFARGTMPKVFDDTCFSLGSGKISGVVASPYGYHVFKLLGRRAAKARSFKEVQAEAERRATAEKRAQAERQLLDQLRSSAEVKINDGALTQVH